MSAENSRLTRAIQRIASQDPELRRAIDAAAPRGDQPGGRGVGESDAERDRVCCDGTVSGDANPGTSERDTSEGGQDGLNPADPADIGDAGPGELTGVVDCATGEPVCFDGDDWVPPPGWDSPQNGPILDGYEEGVYWTRAGAQPSPTAIGTCSAACAAFGYDYLMLEPVGEQLNCICDPNISVGLIGKSLCNGSDADYCNPSDDEIREQEWPSDDCVNLAIKGGKIVGSKYDPENDGSYSAPRKEIELCDPETGDSILIRPSAGGGWKSIQSLAGDIDPDTGNGYLYAPDGRRIRQISPSEFRDDTV